MADIKCKRCKCNTCGYCGSRRYRERTNEARERIRKFKYKCLACYYCKINEMHCIKSSCRTYKEG